MAKRKTKEALPGVGEAFLMPLADGRFGVCRVLRLCQPEEAKILGEGGMLVAGSAWVGTEAPDVNDLRLREILVLSHHAHENSPNVLWVFDPPPAGFQKLGVIAPTEAEAKMACLSASGWEYFPLQSYLQWRWDHEREAVLREDAEKEEQQKIARKEGVKIRQQYLDSLTLAGLRKKKRFAGWKGYVPNEALIACRQIFLETIDALIALGPDPKVRPRLAVLKRCIVRLNDLDEEHDYFIETIAREDLCEEFDEIVYACGLKQYDDLSDRWRDW
jgi:hypothetical protein